MGYMSSTDFGLWVEKHFEDVQNELNDMEKKLPARETLPKLTVNIVKQKLPPRLEKVRMSRDAVRAVVAKASLIPTRG